MSLGQSNLMGCTCFDFTTHLEITNPGVRMWFDMFKPTKISIVYSKHEFEGFFAKTCAFACSFQFPPSFLSH